MVFIYVGTNEPFFNGTFLYCHSLNEVTLDSCSSFQRNKNERFFLCKDVNYLIGCFTVSQIVFNCDDFDMKQFDIDDYKSLKKIIFNSIDAKFIEFSFTK